MLVWYFYVRSIQSNRNKILVNSWKKRVMSELNKGIKTRIFTEKKLKLNFQSLFKRYLYMLSLCFLRRKNLTVKKALEKKNYLLIFFLG